MAAHRDLVQRDEIARAFLSRTRFEDRAKMGQVMTPADVAAIMGELLRPDRNSRVLDPSAGLGVLAQAALLQQEGLPASNLTMVEYSQDCREVLEADAAFRGARIIGRDFVHWAVEQLIRGERWDRIIANPPYLNFHDFDRTMITTVRSVTGVKFTHFTNLFALFLHLGTRLLMPGGRAVFITPTELFSTNYGAVLLASLPKAVHLREIIVFEPEAEPFEDADTTACITLFESSEYTAPIQIRRVVQRSSGVWVFGPTRQLEMVDVLAHPKAVLTGDPPPGPALFPTCELKSLVKASRGIATGANEFFVLSEAMKQQLDPEGQFTVPVVAKAEDLPDGLWFREIDHDRLRQNGRRCWLLYLDRKDVRTEKLDRYLRSGESKGVSNRYLCRARSPWYLMEVQEPPLVFVRVFGRTGLRVALNHCKARTLACCHRLYHHRRPVISTPAVVLLAAFLRSKWGQEAAAHHYRRYGGGLMKLEPSDLEKVLVPDLRRLAKETAEELAGGLEEALRSGKDLQDACDSTVLELLSTLALQSPLSEGSSALTP